MMMAIHIIIGMGALNWSRKSFHWGTIFSGSSFFPNMVRSILASAEVKPTWLNLKSSSAPSPLVAIVVLCTISLSVRFNEALDFDELCPDESDSSADLACPSLDLHDEFRWKGGEDWESSSSPLRTSSVRRGVFSELNGLISCITIYYHAKQQKISNFPSQLHSSPKNGCIRLIQNYREK